MNPFRRCELTSQGRSTTVVTSGQKGGKGSRNCAFGGDQLDGERMSGCSDGDGQLWVDGCPL